MIPIILIAAMVPQANSSTPFQFSVQSGEGLSVTIGGVPIVKGSGFQYYAPGWSKGYYSSHYNSQNVQQINANTVVLTFSDDLAHVSGKETFQKDGDTLHVDATLGWSGTEPALIEYTGAQLWAPALKLGTLTANGQAMRSLQEAPTASVSEGNREFGPANSSYVFATPWGQLSLKPVAGTWNCFDGRNYNQDWATNDSLFWYGCFGEPVAPGQSVHIAYDLTLTGRIGATGPKLEKGLTPVKLSNAVKAVDEKLPLVPYPKLNKLRAGESVTLTGFSFPIGRFLHLDDFLSLLHSRLNISTVPAGKAIAFDGGISDLKLPHQAYRIVITGGNAPSISVLGQDEAGLRYGLRRLALLAYSEGGEVKFPVGELQDWPSTSWRGFHLFGGPKALPFQEQLAKKVLLPMGYNEAVIQCERTAWDTLPNVRGADVMSKADLAHLFDFYRSEMVDPIPLVQSFGHMEWFFQGGKHLDLAFNPQVPYGVDPRKPGTAEILSKLWDEILNTTHATTVHFGCDEVTMRGWPYDPTLATQLWGQQMQILHGIAQKHGVQMMIWGDQALAPSEAPDAANAPDPKVAAERRAAIPKGTLIGDWHYKSDTNFMDFEPVINIWQNAGMNEIASTWYQPDNIRAFTAAAVQEGAGSLATTWAGYTVDGNTVVSDYDQFAEFVLTADYAWSGRQDPVADLNYDYKKLFWELYFQPPIRLKPLGGEALTDGTRMANTSVGRFTFGSLTPTQFYSAIDPNRVSAPEEAHYSFSTKAARVVISANTLARLDEGTEVAQVTIHLKGGKDVTKSLIYGRNIRAMTDPRIAPLSEQENERFAAEFQVGENDIVTGITITETAPTAGLTVYGITAIP